MPLIVSHMFVFYYGIIADLTPPVALAALAAAPIAKASPDAIGWQATRIALAGFLIPFMAVYEPSLMLQDGGAIAAASGYWVEVVVVFAKALFVIGMSGVAAIGYLKVVHDAAGTGAGRRVGLPRHRGFQLQRPGRHRRRVHRHRAQSLPPPPASPRRTDRRSA